MEVQALLARSLQFADDGDWATAAEVLREQLSDFEEDAAVHCWLAVAERELGQEGVAYELFKKALSLGPEDPTVLATIGNGIAAFDDPEAVDALKNAALMGPDLSLTRLLYGAYLSREGFHEWAIEQLIAAREIDSSDPQIAYEMGVAYALSGDIDRATDVMAEAVTLDPDDGWTRVVFGLLLLEDGRAEEASGELSEGAHRLPEDIEAQMLAALAAAAVGLDDIAYEMVERGRMRAADGDLALVSSVEEHVDSGADVSAIFLAEDVAPDALRSRLLERP